VESEGRIIRRERIYGVLLALASVVRATSYQYRPPPPGTVADTYLTLMPITVWVWFLMITAALLFIGAVFRNPICLFFGSFLSFCSYLTFASNLTYGVVLDPTAGWTGIGMLLVIAALHGELLLKSGPMVRRGQRGDGHGS
jgi:hypothetical protein